MKFPRLAALFGLGLLAAGVPATRAVAGPTFVPAITGLYIPKPKIDPGRVSPGVRMPSAIEKILNGKIEVDPGCADEFPQWTKKLEFYDRPSRLCVKWIDKKPTVWARWELWKKTASPEGQKIATGDVPESTLPHTSSSFQIKLADYLPEHNGGSAKQEYYVRVFSKETANTEKLKEASKATLVHLPKSGEVVPPPAIPYNCNPGSNTHEKHVVLEVPKMTVNQTSSTSGDGDRDELYFQVSQLGPGTTSNQKRLPGADDYYEAKNGKTHSGSTWTNQDEDTITHPKLWSGKLKHGQTVTLTVTAMEQDNSDLKSIKDGLIAAMHAVAAVATAVGGPYGAAVAAVAEAVAAGSQMIPNTKNHDFVGFVGVRLTNKCGFVQTTWTTFESQSVQGIGTVTNQFLDVDTQDDFEARLAVVSDINQFWPNGVDYTPFEYAGQSDHFWWLTNGTSSSKYTFLLKQRLVTN